MAAAMEAVMGADLVPFLIQETGAAVDPVRDQILKILTLSTSFSSLMEPSICTLQILACLKGALDGSTKELPLKRTDLEPSVAESPYCNAVILTARTICLQETAGEAQ